MNVAKLTSSFQNKSDNKSALSVSFAFAGKLTYKASLKWQHPTQENGLTVAYPMIKL